MLRCMFLLLFCVAFEAQAASFYQCQGADGSPVFQDSPCQVSRGSARPTPRHSTDRVPTGSVNALLARITGQPESAFEDPEHREDTELALVVDAISSASLISIEPLIERFCGLETRDALDEFHARAANLIALGRYYMANGVNLPRSKYSGGRSARALKANLSGATERFDHQMQIASLEQRAYECSNSARLLRRLALRYGLWQNAGNP